ncbi:sensor histidine kinase [Actinoplanes sp. NPDC051513]|uniref:sensor histidine kinase n=1 Tax=Actinoplanes sp. NPDC051513 TaxID=3363908 RepID=UPI0037880B4F
MRLRLFRRRTPTDVSATSARRSLALTERLISRLDRLEFAEQDPGRLADLFELDHLATQIRRSQESLLVLADAEPANGRREAESLIDVLRAAQSEVEQYTRVEVEVDEPDILVAAGAAHDLVHLVAELLDNAAKFSSPDTAVVAKARRQDGGVLVEITDEGVGLDDGRRRELNERLAGRGRDAEGTLGLAVVARLARRHGLRVELKPAEPGAVAEVALPERLIVATRETPDPAPVRVEMPESPVMPPLAERVRAVVATMSRTGVETTDEGDFTINGPIVVRVKANPPMVDVLSPLLGGVEESEQLRAKLSELTAGMPVGRLYWAGGTVWASVPVFGHDFQGTHLKLAVQVMTGLARDESLKDQLKVDAEGGD